jgi:nitrite reductase/ring-hydroxylating ferredoxin subunit
MPAALTPAAQALPEAPDALRGFRSNDDWDALLAEVDARIEAVEAWPDVHAREQVIELLNGVDAIHREALQRLVRLFKEGVLEQVVTDPAIRTLMEMYDLLPEGEESKPAPRTIPIRALPVAPPPAPRYPHWVPVLNSSAELPPGGLRSDLVADGLPLLLARREGDWFALDANCAVDGSPLQGASARGYTLSCPRHAGCHYDLRNGERIGGGKPIACHPVRVDDDGRVLVGIGIEFRPSLPSF